MKRLLLALALAAGPAYGGALTPSNTYGAAHPAQYKRGVATVLTAKGSTDNEVYMVEVDPATGALPVELIGNISIVSGGKASVFLYNNVYSSVNVTTAAYVQVVASTSAAITELKVFDSSGSLLKVAVGGVGVEVDQAYIWPGGVASIPIAIPLGSRVSIRAVDTNATTGQIAITALN